MDDFERALQENAVDDPHVRWKDPECWKCLSDEQRDVIHQWHIENLIEERDKKEREEKETSESTFWACTLGLSPFAFFHALERGGSFLEILFEAVATLLLWGFIFLLAFSAYQAAREAQHPPFGKLYSVFFHAIALVVSFFVVYCFYLCVR